MVFSFSIASVLNLLISFSSSISLWRMAWECLAMSLSACFFFSRMIFKSLSASSFSI